VTTYAVGDVQGCFDTLMALLDEIEFDPTRDRLWLAGDLVNRGPNSAEVLRWARAHEDTVVSVLGNHDLHLLTRALVGNRSKSRDTIQDVLDADDRVELIDWLRRRPLLHHDGTFAMVHAGLLPIWSVDDVLPLSRAIEDELGSGEWLIERLAVKRPAVWDKSLVGLDRLEAAARILLNLRCCDPTGQPAFDYTGPPSQAPDDRIPWYDFPDRKPLGATVVCGHWAAQGLVLRDDMIALDTGAVWGSSLTAIDLETRRTTSVPLQDDVD